mmetsp:Transcript_56838/g.122922  ORF Transcript_56838/g.122922 Transcript_56838/m.122922 type:complete len:678 (+) Transcript_56838:72-2105(+)
MDAMKTAAADQSFVEDYEKTILAEASTDSWRQPRVGDAVTVEVNGHPDQKWSVHTWTVGGDKVPVDGVDLDRCVRTMRNGEQAAFRRRQSGSGENEKGLQLSLLGLERTEDLLGNGKLLRVTLNEGSGYRMPQSGMELRVRYSWRTLPSIRDELESGSGGAVASCTLLVAGDADTRSAALESKEMVELRRLLLRQCGAVVMHCGQSATPSSSAAIAGSVLRVEQGDRCIVDSAKGISASEALTLARAAFAEPGGPAPNRSAWRAMQEATLIVEEGMQLASKAQDWIPGDAGMRVLADLRTGQRCLVRISPELGFGAQGLPELELPSNATLEYEVELLHIITLEDVSMGSGGNMVKRLLKDGEGYDKPVEGCDVTVSVEVRDNATGIFLVAPRELKFKAASGNFCPAIDEVVLTMKKGESCEVCCTDADMLVDEALGLRPAPGDRLVLGLTLMDFEIIDLYGPNELRLVEHCAARKEVGGQFFQKKNFRQAVRRYQHVTATLAYLEDWKDPKAAADAMKLRRVCHLNSAACNLKLEEWEDAEQSCRAVLKEDPDNIKALFRRGQALDELASFREAMQSFRRVLELDRDNKEATRMVMKLRQSLKAEVEQQKRIFSKMVKGITAEELGHSVADSVTSEQMREVDIEDEALFSWDCLGISGIIVLAGAVALGVFYARRQR